MSAKEYALKFNQLCRYDIKLVYNMRSCMRKFAFDFLMICCWNIRGDVKQRHRHILVGSVYATYRE